jgi:RimJ/RimL family protein N-acetyltransferase
MKSVALYAGANLGSWRAMGKIVMRLEGSLRDWWWLDGEWVDARVYVVLKREWR